MRKRKDGADPEDEFDRVRLDALIDAVADLVASVSNLGDRMETLEQQVDLLEARVRGHI